MSAALVAILALLLPLGCTPAEPDGASPRKRGAAAPDMDGAATAPSPVETTKAPAPRLRADASQDASDKNTPGKTAPSKTATDKPSREAKPSARYLPRVGDVLFQSLPDHELTRMIEGATKSRFSHCGIVAKKAGVWTVIEAIGPTIEIPLAQWIARNRVGTIVAYRLKEPYRKDIPAFIQAARKYLGRPYDTRYRLDDEFIYCSELIYKAFGAASGETMGKLVRVKSLNWKPYEATIRKYEGGDPPLERLLITPRELAKAEQLEHVWGEE